MNNFLFIEKQEILFQGRSLGCFTASELMELMSLIGSAVDPHPLHQIVKATCKKFDIKVHEMMSGARPDRISFPRQVAMALIRERGFSTGQVGAIFGKDHGTVMHATNAVARRCFNDQEVARKVQELRELSVEHIPIKQGSIQTMEQFKERINGVLNESATV